MTKPARLVRERIDPRLTAALFANYRTPVDAVLELVDNAVDSRMDGRTHERGKPVAAELGYVRIEVGGVDRKVDVRRLRARLGGTYRPLLERGDVMMRLDRAPVTPLRWTLEERHDISVRAGGRVVHGWWGLLPDPLPLSQPEAGIRLYHLGRLVGSPEWFGHPGPAQHPALNRLVGEVELNRTLR